MKFRLVEDCIEESINTNLRKFLLELVKISGITLDIENPVIHHTQKDRGKNAPEDLVLMSDHAHRSMHATYRNKEWDNNAHKRYKYIEVNDILDQVLKQLQSQSYVEEQQLSNNQNK